jgi:hypothetical protein
LFTDNSSSSFTATPGSGSDSASVSDSSPGVASGIGSASGNVTISGGGSLSVAAFAEAAITADFDFDAFPPIPDGALISSIRVKIDYSGSGSGNAAGTSTPDMSLVGSVENRIEIPIGTDLPTLHLVASDSGGPATNVNISYSGAITFSVEEELIVGPPIDKATLVANFGTIGIFLSSGGNGGYNGTGGALLTGNASITGGVTLNNFQVLITYAFGPDVTLTPAGGDVEPGQSITVTGPNVADNTYAATNGDQVIPLVPKVIGPDEVVIEVPSPLPACDDCFGDCPECEDCLTACNEDLTGEECQACMDACLDCLVECMDDLEAGEDCQQSASAPPGEIPIVIICQFPGPYTPPVPLF